MLQRPVSVYLILLGFFVVTYSFVELWVTHTYLVTLGSIVTYTALNQAMYLTTVGIMLLTIYPAYRFFNCSRLFTLVFLGFFAMISVHWLSQILLNLIVETVDNPAESTTITIREVINLLIALACTITLILPSTTHQITVTRQQIIEQ